MRILQATTYAQPAMGGTIESIIQLGRALSVLGHSTEVACVNGPDEEWTKTFPLPLHPLGPARTGYGYTGRMIPWLVENGRKYDAVIVNGLWQFAGFAVRAASRRARFRYWVYPHGMLDPWFKRTYPLKHIKKWIYWTVAEYGVLRDAAAVLFTTDEERILARRSFTRYKARDVVTGLGIDEPPGEPEVQRAAFLGKFPVLQGRRYLLFLARLHEKKGCDLLLKAFARTRSLVPGLQLVMAGPDQMGWKPELEKLATGLGVGADVHWTGMLSGDVKWGAFRGADAFVLPSHQENFGIAVAEALALGVPVLISDKVNIWREIHADRAGLVSADNEEGTAHLLERWLRSDDDERRSYRTRAAACFKRRFEASAVSGRLVRILEDSRLS